MTRIAVHAYSRIEASTAIPTFYLRVNFVLKSHAADRQSQNRSVRSACKIIFKVVYDWRSANSLTRDPLHGTLELRYANTRVQQYASWDGTLNFTPVYAKDRSLNVLFLQTSSGRSSSEAFLQSCTWLTFSLPIFPRAVQI